MELKSILSAIDHTALSQTVTWPEIKTLCDEGMQCGVAACVSLPVRCARLRSMWRES